MADTQEEMIRIYNNNEGDNRDEAYLTKEQVEVCRRVGYVRVPISQKTK